MAPGPKPRTRRGAVKSTDGKGSVPGLASRKAALALVTAVLQDNRSLDDLTDPGNPQSPLKGLDQRDRALAYKTAATVLRRHGELTDVIRACLDRGLSGRAAGVMPALLIGAAQLLFMDVKPHAAVDLSVRLVARDRALSSYRPLVNGILRRIGREGTEILAGLDAATANTPEWLLARWSRAYGEEAARAIAAIHAVEPPLDLTVSRDAEHWADRLNARHLPGGTLRRLAKGSIPDLAGFEDGAWWVQDAAAALPARLLGDVADRQIADLCAAPGGKTAQLASAGARVHAVDVSADRMKRLRQNLKRLGLKAMPHIADATQWTSPTLLDGVLLDAPCSATGTIRRNPDLVHLKTAADIGTLTALQAKLLSHALTLIKPAGRLVYCTCSLEPEEGEDQIAALLKRAPEAHIDPISASECPGFEASLRADGTLRILPTALPDPDPMFAGATGFYIARLKRTG